MPTSGSEEGGFTLIEVMVGGLLATIIAAAAFTILVTSNRATKVNEQVADTQQNARVAMELIAQDIKLAGFNMNGPVGNCTIGPTAQPAPIVPLDNVPGGAVGTINDVGPDSVRLVVPSATAGSAGALPVLTAPVNGNVAVIPLAAADITAMVAAGMVARAGATPGSTVSLGGGHASEVTAIAGTTITLASPTPPIPAGAIAFPAGTPVYLVQCVTYAISTVAATCGGSNSCLLRNGVPVVDGIEDLQLAYGCDGCNTIPPNPPGPNGVIDEQDASGGTFTQGDLITNSAWATPPLTPEKIKVVQVTIIARQTKTEQGLSETVVPGVNTAGPVVVSDHDPSADAGYNATTYSQQRRRLLTRTIQVRNIGS